MRNHFWKTLLIGAAICFIAASGLPAQTGADTAASSAANGIDIAVTYSTARSNAVGGSSFWMQGGGVQVHGRIYRGLGVVGDFTGLHENNIQSSGVGLDLITVTVGPRYTWQPAHTRYSFFGQTLVGIADGINSDFPGPLYVKSSVQSLAVKVGGGFNFVLTPHIGFRAVEADWLRTQFPNTTNGSQSNLQLSSGMIFRF
ncbi:MAG: hypothetical protein ACRD3S_01080 [Terracidiphilus sp.]